MRFLKIMIVAALGIVASAGTAPAQQLLETYVAYIGNDDLYNSNGTRLNAPWQILRQDRANFHRYGISQPGDQWDSFFSSFDNRATMERMIRNGYISPGASQSIVAGGAMVVVSIYGQGNTGTSVSVDVYR